MKIGLCTRSVLLYELPPDVFDLTGCSFGGSHPLIGGYSSVIGISSGSCSSLVAKTWKELLDKFEPCEDAEWKLAVSEMTEDEDGERCNFVDDLEGVTSVNSGSFNALGVRAGVEEGSFGGKSGSDGEALSWNCSSQFFT